MTSIFVDTHYLIAIINRRDQWHEQAIGILEKLGYPRLTVTETVLIETLNFFADFRPEAKEHAAESVEQLAANPNVNVVMHTADHFPDGIKLYKSRLDKGYSLTDCISMNVCRELGITDVLTNDPHFTQEGFKILL